MSEGGRLASVGITISDNDKWDILIPSEKYVTAMKQDIEQCFDDCLNIFSCFHVFNPMALPNRDSPELKNYGTASITVVEIK